MGDSVLGGVVALLLLVIGALAAWLFKTKQQLGRAQIETLVAKSAAERAIDEKRVGSLSGLELEKELNAKLRGNFGPPDPDKL